MKKIDTGWVLPTKTRGQKLRTSSMKLDPDFKQALTVFAKRESTPGMKISIPTVLFNLATRDSNELRRKRSELRQLVIQLKKGDHDGRTGDDATDSGH